MAETSAIAWTKSTALLPEPFSSLQFGPVFCSSLADVFDNEVPDEWRIALFHLIHQTPNLSWLLVTKRVGNVRNMVPPNWMGGFPPNVRLLITVVNQEEADRDIPKLLALPCKNGVSYEPALGPVNFRNIPIGTHHEALRLHPYNDRFDALHPNGPRLEWIIVGGESTQGANKARPFNIEWARSTVKQCQAAGVPVFVKQLGSMLYDGTQQSCDANECMVHGCSRLSLKDRAGADPDEWPEDLRVREFPL